MSVRTGGLGRCWWFVFQGTSRHRVKVGIRDDPNVNATVWRIPRAHNYVVEFHTGLLIWSGCLAADLCEPSAKDFAPGVASFRHTTRFLEREPGVAINTLIDALESVVEVGQIGFWRSSFRTMLTVVLVHELAHIYRGHLDLIDDRKQGIAIIDELGVARDQ